MALDRCKNYLGIAAMRGLFGGSAESMVLPASFLESWRFVLTALAGLDIGNAWTSFGPCGKSIYACWLPAAPWRPMHKESFRT